MNLKKIHVFYFGVLGNDCALPETKALQAKHFDFVSSLT